MGVTSGEYFLQSAHQTRPGFIARTEGSCRTLPLEGPERSDSETGRKSPVVRETMST